MPKLIDYKEALRDIRHALAEFRPDQSQKWMNATPQEVAEYVVLMLQTLKQMRDGA